MRSLLGQCPDCCDPCFPFLEKLKRGATIVVSGISPCCYSAVPDQTMQGITDLINRSYTIPRFNPLDPNNGYLVTFDSPIREMYVTIETPCAGERGPEGDEYVLRIQLTCSGDRSISLALLAGSFLFFFGVGVFDGESAVISSSYPDCDSGGSGNLRIGYGGTATITL